jgi:diguanylate cyclase (GGDEF)-like protein
MLLHTEKLIDQLADLAGQRNREALDRCFMDLFHDLLNPPAVAIYRWSDDSGRAAWQVHRRQDRTAHLLGAPLLSSVEPHGPEHALHLGCWNNGALLKQAGPTPLALVPMGLEGDTHCLVEIRVTEPLSQSDERLIRGVQRFYAHLRALLDENERDALTRLLNRKSFDETFIRMALHLDDMALTSSLPSLSNDERQTQAEQRNRCWLGVVDIDHFKLVNDRHGHLIGDEVLILVAQLMRTTFRQGDRLYRFGGEEFVVLLRAAEMPEACAVFEGFRSGVEGFEFPQVGRLTVSIGITEVLPGDTPSSAFERADNAVYHAKNSGRNQLANHDELVRSGFFAANVKASEVEYF